MKAIASTLRRTVHSLLLLFLSASFSHTLTAQDFQLDFSRDDVNPLQAGWEGMGIPSNGGVLTSVDFPNDTLAGAGGSITVSLDGYTHVRDYAPATGVFANLSDLLSDGPLMNAAAVTTLTVEGLFPGVYEFTTYHHTTQFGPSERPPTPFTVTLTDAVAADAIIDENLLMSDNGSLEVTLVTFEATSDGSTPVVVQFEKFGGGDHFAFPALEIRLVATEGDPNIVAPRQFSMEMAEAGVLSIPVTNVGATLPLLISDATISGGQAASFTDPVFPAQIAPGGQGQIEVNFDPAGAFGVFNATLTILSNDGSDGSLEVPLTVHVPDDPNLSVASQLAFPTGPASRAQTALLAISNSGAAEDLTLSETQIDGPDADFFGVVSAPSMLGAGESGEIEIRFDTGGVAGDFTATLTLSSNDASNPEIEVTLMGSLIDLPDASDLMVDFSRGDEGGVEPLQPGWQGFELPATGGTLETATLLSLAAGSDGTVTVSIEGNTHSRDYAPATGLFEPLSDLLLDGPLMNAAGTMTLTIDGLRAGRFEITTFHHTTQFGPSERSPNPITVQLTDSQNTDLLITDTLLTSDNASAALSTLTLQFTSDGVNPVSIDFTKPFSASGDHFALPGFAMDLLGKTGVRITDISHDANSGRLSISWESKQGKLYTLRSELDPSAALPLDWPIFSDGQTPIEEVAATPPLNTLTFPLPADLERYFVIEEFPAPPETVFTDDFEGGVGTWTTGGNPGVEDPANPGVLTNWELGTPSVVGPSAANSGANCWATNLASTYAVEADVWLRSPPIDLTTASGATLNYFQSIDIETQFDMGSVRVLDAADGSELAVVTAVVEGSVPGWTRITKKLPAAALGKTVVIEFRFQSDEIENYEGWYIDDVEVTVP